MTRQEFLLEQIALRRKSQKIESLLTERLPDVVILDGMVCSFVYNQKGDFVMSVVLDEHPLLNGTLAEVEEAFGNGYTVKENNNG